MFVQLLLSLLRNYFHNWSTKKNLIPLFTKRVLINLQKYRFKVLIVVDNVLHLFNRTNRFNFSWILAEFHTLLANNNFIQFSCIMILDVQITFFPLFLPNSRFYLSDYPIVFLDGPLYQNFLQILATIFFT